MSLTNPSGKDPGATEMCETLPMPCSRSSTYSRRSRWQLLHRGTKCPLDRVLRPVALPVEPSMPVSGALASLGTLPVSNDLGLPRHLYHRPWYSSQGATGLIRTTCNLLD
jgi:hypothetical protein